MFCEISTDNLRQEHWSVVYQAPLQLEPGPKRRNKLGVGLLMVGLFGLVISVSPMLIEEIGYRLNLKGSSTVSAISLQNKTDGSAGSVDSTPKTLIASSNANFNLLIPKIHLNTPVVTNVNPFNETEYNNALKNGVAQAAGTGLPGQGEAIYLFGHSSNYIWDQGKYKSVFYLLKDLEVNDQIMASYEGKLYTYKVSTKKIADPSEMSLISKGTKEQLVLQTCWPPFSDWKRLVIVADPVNNVASQPEGDTSI